MSDTITVGNGRLVRFTARQIGNDWEARSASGRTAGIADTYGLAVQRLRELIAGAVYVRKRF